MRQLAMLGSSIDLNAAMRTHPQHMNLKERVRDNLILLAISQGKKL